MNVEKIKFWIENNWNVLLEGKHGVGKTSMLKQACEELGLKWGEEVLYFSGATLDPAVDFSGIPVKKKVENDENEYNAIMELIQFKSINGKKIKNLKSILVAINPDEDDDLQYDTETVDPAQKDRFQIQVEIPYQINKNYFIKNHGPQTTDVVIEWWNNLNKETKNKVSPRRIDIALDVYKNDGDIRDALPDECNPAKLKKSLFSIPAIQEFNNILKSKDNKKMKDWLSDDNNYFDVEKVIKKEVSNFDMTIPNLDDEKISKLINNSKSVLNFCLNEYDKYENIHNVLLDIKDSRVNESLSMNIEWHMDKEKNKKNINKEELKTNDETDQLFEEIFGEAYANI